MVLNIEEELAMKIKPEASNVKREATTGRVKIKCEAR
jgi:hypothetical protein